MVPQKLHRERIFMLNGTLGFRPDDEITFQRIHDFDVDTMSDGFHQFTIMEGNKETQCVLGYDNARSSRGYAGLSCRF